MIDIDQELKVLKDSYKRLKDIPPHRLLPLLAYQYIYLASPDDLRVSDFKRIIVDGKNDGGIDAIFPHPEENRLVIIQSKYYHNPITNKDTILEAFRKINKTITDLKSQKTENYHDALCQIWANEYDSSTPLEVAFLTSADISESLSNKIIKILQEEELPFEPLIYTKKDLEQIIDNSRNTSPWVDSDSLKIDKNNVCKCPNQENGIILNITAKSLKELYIKHHNNLFEQNFRYYVKDKKVDNKIVDSLHKNSQNFWFLNNGIIIACEDFWIDGDRLKLTNFSIINGCQTTSLLGKNDFDNDFYLTCKVIKPLEKDKRDLFVSEIAEASNRQKAIKSRDLKSTEKSMRHLQRQLQEGKVPFFLEIRRGEKPRSKNMIKIKNELYGQMLLAFIFQQPAKARNSKRTMFETEDLYNTIFRRKNFNKETIEDLYFLYQAFEEYKDKKEQFSLDGAETMIGYIHFFILAIAGFLTKIQRNLISIKDLTQNLKNEKLENFYEDNIIGPFLNKDIPDFKTNLEGFFDFVLNETTDIFQRHKKEIGTEANFTKVQSYYPKYVLPIIAERFFFSDYHKKVTQDFLLLFK